MIKYYCDKCNKESDGRFYTIPIYMHIAAGPESMSGHVDGEGNRMSGVQFNVDLCLKCYNEVMYPFWGLIRNEVSFKGK